MTTPTIYHNPRCSKSRQTLTLLQEQGLEPNVVEYLQDPLDSETIRGLLKKLQLSAAELIRKKDHAALGLEATDDEATLIQRMADNPKIIERPIVVVGKRARIGRPPEQVLEIL
jgi:arsenate reductase (glutaredoxin)